MSALMYISVVLTIISLIITVLSYYGIVRYIKLLYSKDCKCFSESYVKLQRVESPNKVVVSMFTKSRHLDKNMTLKSILDQTVHPDQIIIVTDEKSMEVPTDLKKDSIVVLQSAGEIGGLSAILTPLRTQKNSDTKIIVVTDGVIYGPDFIESIVEASNNNPGAVIFVQGYNSKQYVDGKISTSNVDVINIPSGILLIPSLFKDYSDLMGEINLVKNAPNATFSAMIAKNNIKTKRLQYDELFHAKPKLSTDEKITIEYFAQYFKL